MRKICIIGAACNASDLPLSGEREYWSVNNLYHQFSGVKFTRWFELHTFERANNRYIRRGVDQYGGISVDKYMREIDALNIPVYMQRKWGKIKGSRIFPFKEIMMHYGDYFGCSFAWMLGLALLEHEKGQKIERLSFYGVALDGQEYFYQRPSTEYMIGLAKGKGIQIYLHETSSILKSPYRYAIDENFDFIQTIHVEPMKRAMTAFAGTLSSYMQDLVYSDQRKNAIPGQNLLDE